MIKEVIMKKKGIKSPYASSLYWPGGIIYMVLFFIPTVLSLFFSLTRWTLQDWEFIGFENFTLYFSEENLRIGFRNTIIYAVLTSGLKVIFALYLASFLSSKLRATGFIRSVLFFPTLVSTIGVGITFSVLMNPYEGVINAALKWVAGLFGKTTDGPGWLIDPNLLPIVSIALVDVWKGVVVTVKARIASLDPRLEQAAMDLYANEFQTFRRVTLPLVAPGIAGAALLAFSLSFDDFIITNFNSGTLTTFPKFIYISAARGIPAQANVIGSAMFFLALTIVIVGQLVNRRRVR